MSVPTPHPFDRAMVTRLHEEAGWTPSRIAQSLFARSSPPDVAAVSRWLAEDKRLREEAQAAAEAELAQIDGQLSVFDVLEMAA